MAASAGDGCADVAVYATGEEKGKSMHRRDLLCFSYSTVVVTLLAVFALLFSPLSTAAAGPAPKPATKSQHPVTKGPLPAPPKPSLPQHLVKAAPSTRAASTPTPKPLTSISAIDMKVLVLAADGTESDLPAITQALDYLGMPYTVYAATKTPNGLTQDKLIDATKSTHGLYQGIILTTGTLAYTPDGGTTWLSALSPTEWTTLTNYEIAFGIRQVSWYTYPNADFGFGSINGTADWTASTTVPFTTAGRTVFGSYANTATPLKITGAYTYLASPLGDGNSVPLLADASGNALVLVRSYKDAAGALQRENMALTFDSNPYLAHDLVLSYGVINWVTRGTFLGQRHVSLLAQPDDVFNDNDIWTPNLACGSSTDNTGTTYRMSGTDLTNFINWQNAKQAQPTTPGFRVELPFNGVGTTATWLNEEGNPAGQFKPDTLTPAAMANQGQFMWISHTYDHENLDAITYDAAYTELQDNNKVAKQLGLTTYTKKTLVTPDVSGLTNPAFLQAAVDFGVRYTITDTSRAGYSNPSPNAGIYNQYQPSLLMIPRHPTNLYFNVTKPAEWLAEDNCLYPAGAYGHVDTYQQLLDRESNQMLTYLLRTDNDPLMFHQPNLISYDPAGHTLLGDLLDATFAKYNALFTLPIQSPTEEQVGQRMADRMAYNASGVTASIVPGVSITIKATNAATVPVTGVAGTCNKCTVETYGGQTITLVKLSAGQSITLPLK